MKGRLIALDRINGREAAALIRNGVLDDILIATDGPAPEAIHHARVERVGLGGHGAFLATSDGTAYLRDAKDVTAGQALTVQVSAHAEPGKAFPVTTRLRFKGRRAILTPGAPGISLSRRIADANERARLRDIATAAMAGAAHGLILRSAAAGAEDGAIGAEIGELLALAEAVLSARPAQPACLVAAPGPRVLAAREWDGAETDDRPGAFERHDVSDAIAALRSPREALAGGGAIFVEPTRALVAVDVNTGGDFSPAAGLKANIACARALPRALRLRGLGGQIVIDPAPMPRRDRAAFENALRAAFRNDGEQTALVGWTPLGHYELQRKRGRQPLHEIPI